MLVEGTTIFKSHMTKHELYEGQSTGKFALQIKLDGKVAAQLAKDGVKIKEYEGEPIRKFTSRYDVPVYINANEMWDKEIPSGSEVKIEYITKKHPTAGEVPYMKRVLIKEMGKGDAGGDNSFFSDEPPF